MIALTPLESAVRRKAEGVIAGASDADLAALHDAFVPGMVRLNEKGEFVRRASSRAKMPRAAEPLINRLVAARLLIETKDASGGRIEIAHESLFRVWPTLADWLEEEREFLLAKPRIENLYKDYARQQGAARTKALLCGILLERARNWLDRHPERFTREEAAFILASARHADEEWARHGERENAGLVEVSVGQAKAEEGPRSLLDRRVISVGIILALAAAAGAGSIAVQKFGPALVAPIGRTADALAPVLAAKTDTSKAAVKVGGSTEELTGALRPTITPGAGDSGVEAAAPQARFAHAMSLVDAGQEKLRAGRAAAAASTFREAVAGLRALVADSAAQRALARTLEHLGDAELADGNAAAARIAFRQDVEVLGGPSADAGTRQDLASGLAKLAAAEVQIGDFVAARASYARALDVLRGDEDNDADVQRQSAMLREEAGDAELAAGESVAAADRYRAAVKDWDRFESAGDPAAASTGRSRAFAELADVEILAGNLAAARLISNERQGSEAPDSGSSRASTAIDHAAAAAEEQLTAIAARAPAPSDPIARNERIAGLARLGSARLRTGDREGAVAAFAQRLALLQGAAASAATDTSVWPDLARGWRELGGAKLATGDLLGARDALVRALSLQRKLGAGSDRAEAKRDLAASLGDLGDIDMRLAERVGASAAYRESLADLRDLSTGSPVFDVRRDLALALERIGDLGREAGNRAESIAAYREEVAILSDLDKENGDGSLRQALATAAAKLAAARQLGSE